MTTLMMTMMGGVARTENCIRFASYITPGRDSPLPALEKVRLGLAIRSKIRNGAMGIPVDHTTRVKAATGLIPFPTTPVLQRKSS